MMSSARRTPTQSNTNSAATAPMKLPPVSQENCAVISVTGRPYCSAMGPETMPMGASMPDSTK